MTSISAAPASVTPTDTSNDDTAQPTLDTDTPATDDAPVAIPNNDPVPADGGISPDAHDATPVDEPLTAVPLSADSTGVSVSPADPENLTPSDIPTPASTTPVPTVAGDGTFAIALGANQLGFPTEVTGRQAGQIAIAYLQTGDPLGALLLWASEYLPILGSVIGGSQGVDFTKADLFTFAETAYAYLVGPVEADKVSPGNA